MSMVMKNFSHIDNDKTISTVFSYKNQNNKFNFEIDGFSNKNGISIDGLSYSTSSYLSKDIGNFSSIPFVGNNRRVIMDYTTPAANGYQLLVDNGYIDNKISYRSFEQEKDELEQIFYLLKKKFDSLEDNSNNHFEEVLKTVKENKKENEFNDFLNAIASVYNSCFEDFLKKENIKKEDLRPIDRFYKISTETNFDKNLTSLVMTFDINISNINTKNIETNRNFLDVQANEFSRAIKDFEYFLNLSNEFMGKIDDFERISSDFYNNPKHLLLKKHLNNSSFYHHAKSNNADANNILKNLKNKYTTIEGYKNKILDGTSKPNDIDNYTKTITSMYEDFTEMQKLLRFSCITFKNNYRELINEANRCNRSNKLSDAGIYDFSSFENFNEIHLRLSEMQSKYSNKDINLSINEIIKNQEEADKDQIENVRKLPEVEKSLRILLNDLNVENMDAQDRSKYLNYINTTLDEYANFFYKVNTNSGTKAFTRNIDPFLQQKLNAHFNSKGTHEFNRIEYMTKDEILNGFNQILNKANQIDQTPYKVEFADAILNNSNLDDEYRGLVCFENYANNRKNQGFDKTLNDYFTTQIQENELVLLYTKLDELERQDSNNNKYNELRLQLKELSKAGVEVTPHNFFIACDSLNIDIAPSKEYIAKMRAYATLQSIAKIDNSDSFFIYGKNDSSVDEKITVLNEIFSSEDPEKAIESKLLDNVKEWQTAMDTEPSFKNLKEALEQANENMDIDIPYGEDKLNFGQYYEEIIKNEATKTLFNKTLQESMDSLSLMNNLFLDKVPLEGRNELYAELEKNHIIRSLVSEGAIDGVVEINENTRDNLKDILSIRKALDDRRHSGSLEDIEKSSISRLINIIDNTCLDTMFYSNEAQYKNSNMEILTRDKVLELKKQVNIIQTNSEKELENISNIKFSNKDVRGLIFIRNEIENDSIEDFNKEFINSLSEDNLETISSILNLEGDENSKEDIQNALGDKNLLEIRKADGTFVISSMGNKEEDEISALAKEYISKAADKCPKELYKQFDIQNESFLIVNDYKGIINKAFAKDIQQNINGYGIKINNLLQNEEDITKIVLDRLSKDENKDIKNLLDNKFKDIENTPISYWMENVLSRENIENMDLSRDELNSIEKLRTIVKNASDKYTRTHEYKDGIKDYDSVKNDLESFIYVHKGNSNVELLLGSLLTPNGLQRIYGVDESLSKDWIDFCQKHGNEEASSLYNACKQIFEENGIHIKQIVEVTVEANPQPTLYESKENNVNTEDVSSKEKDNLENDNLNKEEIAKKLSIFNENASKGISIDSEKSILKEIATTNLEDNVPAQEDTLTKDENSVNVSEILDEVINRINKQNETIYKNLSNIAMQNMDLETVEKVIETHKKNKNFIDNIERSRQKIEKQMKDSIGSNNLREISKEKMLEDIESKINYIYTSDSKSISDISISIKDENENEVGTIKWDMISKEIEETKENSKEIEKENDNEVEKTSKSGLGLND